MTKINTNPTNGCQEKGELIEKPPMFAFCMKPRGLEVPNKGSKHRSHKKLPVAGQSNATFGDQDVYHAFGEFLCPPLYQNIIVFFILLAEHFLTNIL